MADIQIPADIKPADGCFGSGPSRVRTEAVEALAATGPRLVTFRVSGLITLESGITIKEPFLTIDGSSAPAGGVCIRGNEVVGHWATASGKYR